MDLETAHFLSRLTRDFWDWPGSLSGWAEHQRVRERLGFGRMASLGEHRTREQAAGRFLEGVRR